MRKKLKAFFMMQIICAIVAFSVLSFSMMVTIPSMFGSLSAENIAMQGMQYAELEAKIVKLIDYDSLSDDVLEAANLHTTRAAVTAVDADGWEDEVIVGPEEVMGDGDNKYKIVTINMYRHGDTVARSTLEVPLSSQSSNGLLPPDYTKKQFLFYSVYQSVYFTVGMPYTFSEDGWIEITNNAYSGKGVRSYITLDGVEICYAESGNISSDYYDEANFTSIYPVAKGQIINILQYGYGNTKIYYIPFKK